MKRLMDRRDVGPESAAIAPTTAERAYHTTVATRAMSKDLSLWGGVGVGSMEVSVREPEQRHACQHWWGNNGWNRRTRDTRR